MVSNVVGLMLGAELARDEGGSGVEGALEAIWLKVPQRS
jgi:hypothetical protein